MTKEERTKYLIIGNSAGGIGAAEAIRLICPDLDKTWIPVGGQAIVGSLEAPLQSQPVAARETI